MRSRLPRVRFTVRRLMVAVAVAAVLMGLVAQGLRRASLLRLADYHAREARRYRTIVVSSASVAADYRAGRPGLEGDYEAGARLYSDQVRWFGPLADHHEALRGKYERAARRPWLPVEPDLPPPQ